MLAIVCFETQSITLGYGEPQNIVGQTTNLVVKGCVVWTGSCLIEKSSFIPVSNVWYDAEINASSSLPMQDKCVWCNSALGDPP